MADVRSTSPQRRLSVLIKGRVQGVGYRYHVWEQAARWPAIVGYVRNTPQGHVEVVAEGPEEQLRRFLQAVSQGPPGARVEAVEVDWSEPEGTFRRFDIRY